MRKVVSQIKMKRKIAENSRRMNRKKKAKSCRLNPFGFAKTRKEAAQKKRESNRNRRDWKKREAAKRHANKIMSLFDSDCINALARASGFLRRESKLIPVFFITGMILSYFSNGEQSLVLMAGNMADWFNISVSTQAFSERLKNKQTLTFLKESYHTLFQQKVALCLAKNGYFRHLTMFSGIKVGDSTSFDLIESLAKNFKGSGGGASKSSLKLNFLADVFTNSTINVDIKAGSYSDKNFSKQAVRFLKKKELLIRDLGYFFLDSFKAIASKGAYFISRLLKNVKVYSLAEDDGAVDLHKFLKKGTRNGRILDQIVFLGHQKFPARLIAFKTPKWVVNQRAKKFKAMHKKDPSPEYIEWAGYSVFVTNIDRSICSAELVIELYKIRWQIELFFKSYKSTLKVDVIKGTNRNCVLCIVYAKLMGILITDKVISFVAAACEDSQEISVDKTIKLLKSGDRLVQAILNEELESLLNKLVTTHLKFCCKDKRNSDPTTCKKVIEVLQDPKNSFLHKRKNQKTA